MHTIRLNSFHDVTRWVGEYPTHTWFERLVPAQDVTVLKPDGTPLLVVVRRALTGTLYQTVYEAVAPLARSSPRHNRGIAAGKIQAWEDPALLKGGVAQGSRLGRRSATRYQPVKLDGTVSKTVYGKDSPSFVMGYSDRSARFPYCRQTAYTAQYPGRTHALLPCLAQLSALLHDYVPERYAAQADVARQTSPDFLLAGTIFTTLTINRNWATALHTDKGDLAAGFGVMACLRAGTYTGGLYVMPAYGIAVDLHAGDVLLSDVHEWHGNTPIVGDPKYYERITVVCYYRARMAQWGSSIEELARVKRDGQTRMRV